MKSRKGINHRPLFSSALLMASLPVFRSRDTECWVCIHRREWGNEAKIDKEITGKEWKEPNCPLILLEESNTGAETKKDRIWWVNLSFNDTWCPRCCLRAFYALRNKGYRFLKIIIFLGNNCWTRDCRKSREREGIHTITLPLSVTHTDQGISMFYQFKT